MKRFLTLGVFVGFLLSLWGMQSATGYTPLSYDGTTGAGYKDWAMQELGIPSLTIEIGCYDTPLPQQEIYSTFARCRTLLPAINIWLEENA